MENLLEIGIIVKPQGIKGEVKVQTFSSDIERLKGLKSVIIGEKEYKIVSKKFAVNALLLGLFGVSDRDMAETFRGKSVFAKRTELKDLEDGVYYVADLIGLTLIVGEKEVGKITEILSLKTDVITVSTLSGKTLRFPFLKDLQAKVNFESKTFAVLEERFNQVVCYEN